MAILVLPLQSSILRASQEGASNRVKELSFGLGAKESVNDPLTPKLLAWEITYKPLTLSDRDTLVSFLLGTGSTKYISYTSGCTNPITYTVRMGKDSLKETRKKSKYYISFTLLQQVYL